MQMLYLTTVLLLFYYFAVRPFDISTLAFLSAFVYFAPGLYSYYSISNITYAIWIFVLLTIFIAAVTLRPMSEMEMSHFRSRQEFHSNKYCSYLTFLSLVFPVCIFVVYGPSSFFSDKLSVESKYPVIIHYSWSVILGYSLICALVKKNLKLILLCIGQYFLIIASGDRTQVVVAILSCLLMYSYSKTIRILDFFLKIKYVLALLVLVFLGVFGKGFYGFIQLAYVDMDRALDFFNQMEFANINYLLSGFEPYHTQYILQMAVDTGLTIPADYLLYIPLQVLPWSGEFGGDVHIQSQMIKQAFFSGWSDESGVASNIWAELYMLSSFFGLLVFLMFFYFGIVFFHNAIRRWRGLFCFAAPFMAVLWVFYIHRNSLLQMIGHEKRYIYLTLFLSALFFLYGLFVPRLRKSGRV